MSMQDRIDELSRAVLRLEAQAAQYVLDGEIDLAAAVMRRIVLYREVIKEFHHGTA